MQNTRENDLVQNLWIFFSRTLRSNEDCGRNIHPKNLKRVSKESLRNLLAASIKHFENSSIFDRFIVEKLSLRLFWDSLYILYIYYIGIWKRSRPSLPYNLFLLPRQLEWYLWSKNTSLHLFLFQVKIKVFHLYLNQTRNFSRTNNEGVSRWVECSILPAKIK